MQLFQLEKSTLNQLQSPPFPSLIYLNTFSFGQTLLNKINRRLLVYNYSQRVFGFHDNYRGWEFELGEVRDSAQ